MVESVLVIEEEIKKLFDVGFVVLFKEKMKENKWRIYGFYWKLNWIELDYGVCLYYFWFFL